ncbi:MAG: hypothetical protein WCP85_25490 [Mariniphaga sp.]
MTYSFKDVMVAKTDAELVAIVTGSADDYQPAALQAAREEFAKRNISAKQLKILEKDVTRQQQLKVSETLSMNDSGQQILEKIFPGIVNAISPGSLPENETDKKTWQIAKRILKWSSIGIIVLYILLELIFSK